jgi:hypothetical protein
MCVLYALSRGWLVSQPALEPERRQEYDAEAHRPIGGLDRDPIAFNHEAAEASVRVNGFYLFQMIKPLAISFPVQHRSGGRGKRLVFRPRHGG